MRSVAQLAYQYDMHKQLKLSYREFFESRLAVFLLEKAELFAAVRKISMAILFYMQNHKQSILKQIFMDSKIRKELYELNYFGHLPQLFNVTLVPEKIFSDIKTVLENARSPLSQIMQIHCVFIYRIYDYLEKADRKQALLKKYFVEDLHVVHGQSRVLRDEKKSLTQQLGISNHAVFKKLIGQDSKHHARAVDRFLPDFASPYCQQIAECNLPFVAGPSGHTRSLLLGALLYGDLNQDELKEYVLAIFVFLAAGGNHSFHEVMQVASKVGVPYDMKNYSVSMPSSFVNSAHYKVLSRIFPEYLDEPAMPVVMQNRSHF